MIMMSYLLIPCLTQQQCMTLNCTKSIANQTLHLLSINSICVLHMQVVGNKSLICVKKFVNSFLSRMLKNVISILGQGTFSFYSIINNDKFQQISLQVIATQNAS